MANGGTLLLDEIGEMPVELQAKLLRALQEGRFEPVGSDRSVKVDVRILAATHVDLEEALAARRFREDLYYRLSVFPLRLPPLRERLQDLPRLVEVLLAEQSRRTGHRGTRVAPEGLKRLAAHPGRGTCASSATCWSARRSSRPGASWARGPRAPGPSRILRPAPGSDAAPHALVTPAAVATLDDVQRDHIRRVLALTGGRLYGRQGAAALLGLKPTTLQSRMKRLGVSRFGVS